MDKRFQFLIYDSTAGSAEHTITQANLRSIPESMGGQNIRPLEGRADSRPWQIEITDTDDYFTQTISSGGRYVLLNRLAEMQVSVDGSTYDTVAVGRISDIQDHVSHYSVTVDDERTIERTAEIFTTVATTMGSTSLYAGTRVLPPGIDGPWRGFGPGLYYFYAPYELSEHTTVGNWSLINHESLWHSGVRKDSDVLPAMPEVAALISDDLKDTVDLTTDQSGSSTAGAFTTLRCRYDGSDLEVIGFTLSQSSSSFPTQRELILEEFRRVVSGERQGDLNVWVLSTAALSTGSVEAYLYMPDHVPTEAMPLHVGGGYDPSGATTDPYGIRPFQLVKDIYDEVGVIYSSDTLQALIDDPRFGLFNLRITRKQNAARFLEDHVYKPLGVLPTVNATGAVAPILTVAPESSDVGGDITGLTLFTSTNTAWSHPQWHHADPVTRITYSAKSYKRGTPFGPSPFVISHSIWGPTPGVGLDFVVQDEREIVHEHDRIDQLGVHEMSVAFDGYFIWHSEYWNYGLPWGGARTRAETLAEQTFSRYGDGRVNGTLIPLSSADTPSVGDYIRINIPTFPNAETTGRGGTRIVQVVTVTEHVEGPACEWLDAGQNAQPLSAPTVALTSSAVVPKHRLTATVGGLSAGASFELSMASGSAAPASSGEWTAVATGTTSSLTVTLDELASGTTYHARVRAYQANRIGSTWSASTNEATEALTAPTALASSSVTANTAELHWSNQETDYNLEFHLDQSATCPSSGLAFMRQIEAGTNMTKLEGLTLNTTHCAGLRYYDIFGGYSTMSSLSIQTTTTPAVAPNMADLMVFVGNAQVAT